MLCDTGKPTEHRQPHCSERGTATHSMRLPLPSLPRRIGLRGVGGSSFAWASQHPTGASPYTAWGPGQPGTLTPALCGTLGSKGALPASGLSCSNAAAV